MKTIKKTIETSLEANLMKEPMSALLFLQLIEVDCDFFDQNLKHKQKAYSIFFYFQISLLDFFLWLVSPGFCFFCVFDLKKQNLGDRNWL